MKYKRSFLRKAVGCAALFAAVAVSVSAAVMIYATIKEKSDISVALTMIGVIVLLSALCTLIDFLRRKYTVDRTLEKILDATERIASGDFSVRIDIKHSVAEYTEYDVISENINKVAAELSKTEVLRTDFVSNVSHELKTPITVIQNYVTALQDKTLSEETREAYSKTLLITSRRLTALLTNILKLNKLENQELKVECEKMRLDERVGEAVLGFEEKISEKNLELDCDFDEVEITSSTDYLDIVWNNLLSNAIKFTPEGGKIAVKVKEENGKAVVAVTDTGCGMDADTGRHIFDKFYQGDTSHSGEGNGLGLALVKKVIDVLGGDISVESEVGKGSTFTVRLKDVGHE